MSGFNLDFSGLFNSGAFALDPSKFDFSAYAPKKETVTDPVDVVSNNTPDAQVDILEGAGTVAITKQPEVRYSSAVTNAIAPTTPDLTATPTDPITDAIQSVQPKTVDLGMDFSVTPETADVSPLTSDIPVSSGSTTNGSFMDVGAGQTGLSSNVNTDVGVEKAYDLLDGSLESNNDIEDINNYLKSEQFSGYMSEYDNNLSVLGDYKKASGATTNLLNQVGLPKALGVQGKYGGYKNYTYNGETNQYELTGDTEKSAFEAAAPDIIVGVATAAATAGLGSVLGAATGATGVIGTAATNAVASVAVQQLVTGEVDPKKVALAALGGALQGAEAADVAANADLAGAYADFGADSIEYANALSAANEATSTLELVNNISTGVDVVSAIEDKNVVKAFDLTASMLDAPTLSDVVSEKLSSVVSEDYVDAATDTVLRAGSTAIQGGDVGEVLQDAGNEFLINQYATEKAVQERFGFEGDWSKTASRTISSVATDTLKGESSKDIALAGLETFLDNAIRLIPEGENSSDYLAEAEKWWHENVEDPLENWWQEIEDTRNAIEAPFKEAYDAAVKIGEAAVNAVDAGIRAVPTTKEDWENAAETVNNTVVDPVADVVRETGRGVEEVYDTAEDFVKEEVAPVINQAGRDVRETIAPVTETVRETGRAIEQGYGAAEDFVKEEVAPVIRETGRDIREVFSSDSDVAAIPGVNIPEVDIPFSVEADPEITQERRGFYYDDSSLVSNPFLRGGEQQRIRSLTDMIAMEKEAANRQAKILADEEERKLRYKSVFGVNPNVQVKYNG